MCGEGAEGPKQGGHLGERGLWPPDQVAAVETTSAETGEMCEGTEPNDGLAW